MSRLLQMLAGQYLLGALVAAVVGVAAYASGSWAVAKPLVTFAPALAVLAGTWLGWRQAGARNIGRARPGAGSTSAGGAAAGRSSPRLARGLAGVPVGFLVFANVGLALGLCVGYFVGGDAMFEVVVPMGGALGGGAGLFLGYALGRA